MRNAAPASLVIVILTGFSLLFCIHTAYGRVSTGLEAARTSRYATYLIPGFLGIYFHALTLKPGMLRRAFLVGIVMVVTYGCGPVHPEDDTNMNWFSRGKRQWKAAYLATGSVEEADRLSQFKIYPWPERTRLSHKLQYLRERNLNLFRTPT